MITNYERKEKKTLFFFVLLSFFTHSHSNLMLNNFLFELRVAKVFLVFHFFCWSDGLQILYFFSFWHVCVSLFCDKRRFSFFFSLWLNCILNRKHSEVIISFSSFFSLFHYFYEFFFWLVARLMDFNNKKNLENGFYQLKSSDIFCSVEYVCYHSSNSVFEVIARPQ